MEAIQLQTKEALRLAGVAPGQWANLVGAHDYSEAPKTMQGVTRVFDLDDLVGLFLLKEYQDVTGSVQFAARVAVSVRKALRRKECEDAETLWIVVTSFGRPHAVTWVKPPDHLSTISIPLEQIRKAIIQKATKLGYIGGGS